MTVAAGGGGSAGMTGDDWLLIGFLLFIFGGTILQFCAGVLTMIWSALHDALTTRHKRRLDIEKQRAKAMAAFRDVSAKGRVMELPPPPVITPHQAMCGCGHDLAFHDPATGHCYGLSPGTHRTSSGGWVGDPEDYRVQGTGGGGMVRRHGDHIVVASAGGSGGGKSEPCPCRQYTGPELLGRVVPPPVIDPDTPQE